MIRTRVGYTGGLKLNPTYRAMGDHTEAFQVDYDPKVVSYEELLEVFWQSHRPTSKPWSRQYAAAVFYHNEEQKRLAEESRAVVKAKLSKAVHTSIIAASEFTLAEDYHQKYYLRQTPDVAKEFERIYPRLQDFVNSTAAARVNSYLGGHGRAEDLDRELPHLGLSSETQATIKKWHEN